MELLIFCVIIIVISILYDVNKKRRTDDDRLVDYYNALFDERKKIREEIDNQKSQKNEYKEYLKSPQWLRFRLERLAIDENTCQQCGTYVDGDTVHCHHITYKNLYNENVETDLVSVCKQCHKYIHKHYGKDARFYPIIKKNEFDVFQ